MLTQFFSLKEALSFFQSVCMCVHIVVRLDVPTQIPKN